MEILVIGAFLLQRVRIFYGRAKSAKINKYGDALHLPQRDTGFYDKFESLNRKDIQEIKKEIESIFKQEKYQDKNWRL